MSARAFVIVGERAISTNDFLLDDLPGTSGRLDVLLRCVRAALLTSHGVRTDTCVYLVLRRGPRVVRIDGATVQFLRPDERALAVLMRKVLASDADEGACGFVEVKPGISLARGGVDVVVADLGGSAKLFVLREDATRDIREVDLSNERTAFLIGDHTGIADDLLTELSALGAEAVALGPVSVHADDVVAIVTNELDRRGA